VFWWRSENLGSLQAGERRERSFDPIARLSDIAPPQNANHPG
jgi:hypothetical protein